MSTEKQDIKPYNHSGQPHGWWEVYHTDNKLLYRGNYVNGKQEGFWVEYWYGGDLWYKGSKINGMVVGYAEFGNRTAKRFHLR